MFWAVSLPFWRMALAGSKFPRLQCRDVDSGTDRPNISVPWFDSIRCDYAKSDHEPDLDGRELLIDHTNINVVTSYLGDSTAHIFSNLGPWIYNWHM